jgi:hypothetical protein
MEIWRRVIEIIEHEPPVEVAARRRYLKRMNC